MLSLEKFEVGDRTVAVMALVGSHNYKLNGANSDKDYKLFVLPSFDDLYKKRMYTHAVVSDDCDYTVHDLRQFSSLVWKGNVNFVEVLFSSELYFHPWLGKYFTNKAEQLAAMNLPGVWSAAMGMASRKSVDMYNATAPCTRTNVEKYGYDLKNAMHALRLYDFLSVYKQYGSFKTAMCYNHKRLTMRNLLLNVRDGQVQLDDVQYYLAQLEAEAKATEDWFKSQSTNEVLLQELNSSVYNLVKTNL